MSASGLLAGRHVLVLNWSDVNHPQAGGAERYMHEISRRWVADGLRVTWFTARPDGADEREVIDGVTVLRAGGVLGVYLRAAARLLRNSIMFDAVVDCQNGIPFFSPALIWRIPTVQVVHHVHQDQFAVHFGRAASWVGRFLERDVSRLVYRHAAVAVSPSTRHGLRTRLGFSGDVYVVPNGGDGVPDTCGPRDPDPTITVVSRLVSHKRVDVLVHSIRDVVAVHPRLKVHIVGDGPQRPTLEALSRSLGLDEVVTFHGRQPDPVRDQLLNQAWITAVCSDGEGWGISVIEAAALGVPCVGIRVAGVQDSVLDGTTGWLVPAASDVAPALSAALSRMSDPEVAANVADSCREWAGRFTWDRSARLMGGVLADEIARRDGQRRRRRMRRSARSDMSVVVHASQLPSDLALRPTDEYVVDEGGHGVLLLHGCDELGARARLTSLGAQVDHVRVAGPPDILVGPRLEAAPSGAHE